MGKEFYFVCVLLSTHGVALDTQGIQFVYSLEWYLTINSKTVGKVGTDEFEWALSGKNRSETAITPEQSINNSYEFLFLRMTEDGLTEAAVEMLPWCPARGGQRPTEPGADTDPKYFSNDFPAVTPIDVPAAWKTPAMESVRRIKARDETPKKKGNNSSVWRFWLKRDVERM